MHDLGPLGRHLRLAVLHHDGAGEDPIDVRDPARERPPAADADPSVDAYGRAGRRGDPRVRKGRVGEDFLRAHLVHETGHRVVRRRDHGAPTGRAVGRRDHLDRAHHLGRRSFLAAERFRDPEAEYPGFANILDEIARHPAGLLDLLTPRSDRRQQRVESPHVHDIPPVRPLVRSARS